jgi:GNAT superfamily N-acetyltransferase
MAITIRPARPGDGDGMARVWASAADYYADLDPEHFQRPQPHGLAESFENSISEAGNDALLLVAELDGHVAGWLAARIQRPEEDAAAELAREPGWTRLAIDILIVDTPTWRHGAGTALLQAAESWGRDRGARVARLGTYAHSPVSVPFYETRMGYERRAIIFQKELH